MKINWICFLTITCFLTSCAPAQNSITPTFTTAAPTATATIIPTSTPTETPTPEPVGGTGKLMIMVDNEIRLVNADGSGEKTIISKQQFEKEFAPIPSKAGIPYWSANISPDGTKLLVLTCTRESYSCATYKLYMSDMDLKRVRTSQEYKGGFMEWASDSNKILVRATGGITGSTDVMSAGADFGKVTHLPISSSAFLSSDGNQVYYYNQGWFIVNSDGTGMQPLKCDMCSLVKDPSNLIIAESPDRKWVAVGYLDGTVIIASSSDFSNFKLASVGAYISQIHWSPDGQKMAVDVNTDSAHSDVIILGMDGTVIEKLVRPKDVNFIATCGWSPDGKQIDYLGIPSTGHNLYLHALGHQKPFKLLSMEGGDQSCPVWLPANP